MPKYKSKDVLVLTKDIDSRRINKDPYLVELETGQQVVVYEKTFGKITPQQAALHTIGKVAFLILDIIIGAIIQDKEQQEGKPNKEQIRMTQRISKTVVIKVA